MAFQEQIPILNPQEAPAGFVAVLKSEAKPSDGGNICRACDWRSECNDKATEFTALGHRCMGYPVVTKDGRAIQRADGCSVIFKRAQAQKGQA